VLALLILAGKETASNVVPTIKIDEFMSFRSQPVAALHFSADGTSLAVIQRDGYAGEDVQDPSYPFCYSGIFSNNEAKMTERWSGHFRQQTSNSVKMYTLRRGRTSAAVEGADWSKDGRWLRLGRGNVFPVNPYGGKADIASHLEGRVTVMLIVS
jgi:hypothetical protein